MHEIKLLSAMVIQRAHHAEMTRTDFDATFLRHIDVSTTCGDCIVLLCSLDFSL